MLPSEYLQTLSYVPCNQNEQWQRLFPMEVMRNSTQSLNFMKKLTMIGMSSIAFTRDIFPRQAFEFFEMDNLKIAVMKERSMCPQACETYKWIKAAYDAIDKQYLKQLVLCIYKKENDFDSLIESYSFKYKYENKEKHDLNPRSNDMLEAIKKSTCLMLNSIIRLKDICKNKLPEHYYLGIQLYYFDEAPNDYQPEGYSQCFDQKKYKSFVIFGQVHTPFHKVLLKAYLDRCKEDDFLKRIGDPMEQSITKDLSKMNIQGETINNETAIKLKEVDMNEGINIMGNEQTEIVDNDETDATQNEEAESTQYEETDMSIDEETEIIMEASPQREPSEEINSSNIIITQKGTKSHNSQLSEKGSLKFALPPKKDLPILFTSLNEHSSENEIRCPCDKNVDSKHMLKCTFCNTRQHASCFGLIHKDKPVQNHICDICTLNGTSTTCTDPFLLQLDSRQKQRLCEFRLALIHCLNLENIDASVFVNDFAMSKNSAIKLMSRLEKKDVFIYQSPLKVLSLTQVRKIDQHFLKTNLISKYFQENFDSVNSEQFENSSVVNKVNSELTQNIPKSDEIKIVKQVQTRRKSKRQQDNSNVMDVDENYNTYVINKETTEKRTSSRIKHPVSKYTPDIVNQCQDDEEVPKKKFKRSITLLRKN